MRGGGGAPRVVHVAALGGWCLGVAFLPPRRGFSWGSSVSSSGASASCSSRGSSSRGGSSSSARRSCGESPAPSHAPPGPRPSCARSTTRCSGAGWARLSAPEAPW